MSYRDHKGFIHSAQAATTILPGQAVRLTAGAGDADIQPVTGITQEPYAVGPEATSPALEPVTVYGRDNIVKVKAAASLGHGADVAPPGATSGFAPVAGTTVTASTGTIAWRTGVALESAAAGESFALHVNPRQLSTFA